MDAPEPLEMIWDNLLSRSPERIRAVFASLDEESRCEVIAHLKRMASEDGWHPEQVASARAALDTLKDLDPSLNE